MAYSLPKVLPVNELKNTAKITQTCKESDVPIIITKNGYGEMVLMSVELYEKLIAQQGVAALVNEAIDEIDAGAEPMEGKQFFDKMRTKYGV